MASWSVGGARVESVGERTGLAVEIADYSGESSRRASGTTLVSDGGCSLERSWDPIEWSRSVSDKDADQLKQQAYYDERGGHPLVSLQSPPLDYAAHGALVPQNSRPKLPKKNGSGNYSDRKSASNDPLAHRPSIARE